MICIGIPIYNSRETLPSLLNSLCAQTKKNFIVCIYDDASPEDCDDIVERFSHYLHIHYIKGKENKGPGIARQEILNWCYEARPQMDYIAFADSDDLFYPRAIDILYNSAKKNNYDVLDSPILMEQEGKEIFTIEPEASLTWVFGKCYKLSYLKEKNLRFLNELRLSEDSYWNLIVHLLTENKGYINEPVYLWRNNHSSLTRSEDDFNINHIDSYLYSQVQGAAYILNTKYDYKLAGTFNNIYNSYQKIVIARPELLNWADQLLKLLFANKRVKELFNDPRIIQVLTHCLKQSEQNESKVYFYTQTFNEWCKNFGIILADFGKEENNDEKPSICD